MTDTTTEATGPVYTWMPIEEPMVETHVETDWTRTIYLSITGTASVGETLPSVSSYSYTWGGETVSGITISNTSSGIVVTAKNVSPDIFPAEDIEYQVLGGTAPPWRITKHATRFSDLPSKVDEVIRYIPTKTKSKTFTITVTAKLSNGVSMTAVFSIVLKTDYSSGKKSLQGAVNASRG